MCKLETELFLMNVNTIINLALLFLSAAAILYIFIISKRHMKFKDEMNLKFLEAEDKANAVRKKEISPDLFFTPDMSELPPVDEGDPHKVERCAKRKMIYFREPQTNLELKQEYGGAQVEYIAQFEENFHDFLKALTAWATSLAEKGDDASIKQSLWILGYAIAHGSEFRRTYRLAADLYAQARDTNTLHALFETAERQHFKDPAIRLHILEYINEKINQIEGNPA